MLAQELQASIGRLTTMWTKPALADCTAYKFCCRQNLVEADTSDRKLEKLVDDNATAFAALGLGTLPGRDSGKQVQPAADMTPAAAYTMTRCTNLMPSWPWSPGEHPHAGKSYGCRAASMHCCGMASGRRLLR